MTTTVNEIKSIAYTQGLIHLINKEISREKELTNRNEKLITGLENKLKSIQQ